MTDFNDVMLNPIRLRIFQELAARERMTAAELCEKLTDVPRTTLYRHINVLLENDILTVVSEKKVRGSLERTFALNIEVLKKQNRIENASQQIFAFLMNRYTRYHNYFQGENPDTGRDRIFYSVVLMMLNDSEFDQFLTELSGLITRYSFEVAEGRKARDICVMSVPVERE